MTPAPTKPSEALRAARDLLTPEGAWTQGASARTEDGIMLHDPRSEEAICWCSLGALRRVVDDPVVYDGARSALRQATGGGTRGMLSVWNDSPHRTQADIVHTFSSAIALAEEAGQ